jgi:hypothetical protein
MKAYWESESIAPRILDLGTRCWATWIQFTPSQFISIRCVSILSSHLCVGLSSSPFPLGFPFDRIPDHECSSSPSERKAKYGMITNDVSDFINLFVRIAHVICNHPYYVRKMVINNPICCANLSLCTDQLWEIMAACSFVAAFERSMCQPPISRRASSMINRSPFG